MEKKRNQMVSTIGERVLDRLDIDGKNVMKWRLKQQDR
jgi:3-polyprenyl-4-hydroxybenzoate decarboxylase